MSFIKVPNGFAYDSSKIKKNHQDKRLSSHARLNIYNSHTKTRDICPSYYQDRLICMNCSRKKPKSEFKNYAVHENDRKHLGLNIHCRSCQKNQYICGYLIDDFVTNEEDFEYDEEDEDYEEDE